MKGPTSGRTAARVAIATTGRFHVLDLARELSALGYDVAFYSYLPKRRCVRFALPAGCHRSVLGLVIPVILLRRFGPRRWRAKLERLIDRVVDRAIAARLEPTDIFIGMSGICVESAQRARDLGAIVIIERASRHVLSQREILERIAPAESLPSRDVIERESWAYDFADVISVPSRHVEQSFVERGIAPAKLFRNSYGVDIHTFAPTPKPQSTRPTLLFVGTWSLRKGADLLWQACSASEDWELLHVGPVGDLPLPESPRFKHVAPVSQEQLPRYYAAADVFVLPSREDGFGVVLAQALACGLPVVCSDMTGGADLRELLGDVDYITQFRSGDQAELQVAIGRAVGQSSRQSGMRDLLGSARDSISWQGYGRRYADCIDHCIRGHN